MIMYSKQSKNYRFSFANYSCMRKEGLILNVYMKNSSLKHKLNMTQSFNLIEQVMQEVLLFLCK